MPKPPLPARQRRDQPVTAMLTPAERNAVDRVAAEMGMSRSNAARYLIARGLSTFTPEEET